MIVCSNILNHGVFFPPIKLVFDLKNENMIYGGDYINRDLKINLYKTYATFS